MLLKRFGAAELQTFRPDVIPHSQDSHRLPNESLQYLKNMHLVG